MARTQAADYDDRRAAILDTAARLFAANGFRGTSVAELALACGTSKSLIYHYYSAKEDMLFAVMDSHLKTLLLAVAAVPPGPAPERLRGIVRALMHAYAGAAAWQKVLLNELNVLPAMQRAAIVAEQRALIEHVQVLVEELAPALDTKRCFAAAMLLFGMINWTYTWWDPAGAVGADDFASLASDTFLNGLV